MEQLDSKGQLYFGASRFTSTTYTVYYMVLPLLLTDQ